MENKYHLTDLIEPEELRKIENSFSEMFMMAAWICDENGVGLDGGAGFPAYADRCLKSPAGRRECEQCIRDSAAKSLETKQPQRAECLGGLSIFTAPIMVDEQFVGILAAGWVMTDAPDYDKLCRVAQLTGETADMLSSDAAAVRIISQEEVKRAEVYTREFAKILSGMAHKSAQVARVSSAAAKAASQRRDFLANVSHEMRTPLNAIFGMTEMALHNDMSPQAKEYVHQIKSSGRHLLTIINDILDYSSIDSGEMPIVAVKYEILSLVNDVAGIVNSQIGSKDIEFTIDLPVTMPKMLVGDNVRIQQILINLLNNAVKFTQSGHIGLLLQAVPAADGTVTLHAEVSDTGCGIKKENLDKLFMMFRQVDSKRNRNVEGTGLGLAISRKLVKLMGGTITARSEFGKGSTFIFDIPQKTASAPFKEDIRPSGAPAYLIITNKYLKAQIAKDLSAVGSRVTDVTARTSACGNAGWLIVSRELFGEDARELLRTRPELKCLLLQRYDSLEELTDPNIFTVRKPAYSVNLYASMDMCDGFVREESSDEDVTFTAPEAHILIVDDNAINLSVAKGVIEPIGMQVDTASSAAEALEKVRDNRYDLIFMDHMMPEVDGIEATHMIRQRFPSYAEVPIIALTANVAGGAREMFLREGFNDFVAKPIVLRDIISKIRRWLSDEKIIPVAAQNAMPVKTSAPAAGNSQSSSAPSGKRGVLPKIAGVDTDSALALLKNPALLRTVMEQFYRSVKKNEALIRSLWKTNDIKNFTIQVHSLKSTAKQIGATRLSTMAALLEQAGNSFDMDFISRHTNALLNEYLRIGQELEKYFGTEMDEAGAYGMSGGGTPSGSGTARAGSKPAATPEQEKSLLDEMQNALDEMDTILIDDVIEKMSACSYGADEQALFEKLSSAAEECDIDAAQEILTEWKQIRH